MKRRKFILSSALASMAASTLPFHPIMAQITLERKFKIALNPGIIGVKANLSQTLDYAIQYGYETISPFTAEVMNNYSDGQIKEISEKMASHNIGYGSTNIPVDFRKDRATFHQDFKGLRKFCQVMEKQGATRMNTWIIASHDELSYSENMKQHAYRLGECARVMKDHGIKLGLEYLGTRPLVTQNRYPFISTMKEGKELIAATGQSNVGFVLDAFHWYTANDTLEDIRSLKPEDIVVVDINDAREGFTRETQVDGKRELPLATGVIDLKSFMQGLVDIGYDGPLRTEPFNQALNELENEEALEKNMASIKKTLALVGL